MGKTGVYHVREYFMWPWRVVLPLMRQVTKIEEFSNLLSELGIA